MSTDVPNPGGPCALAAGTDAHAPLTVSDGNEKVGHYFGNPSSYTFGIHNTRLFFMVVGSLTLFMVPCPRSPWMDSAVEIYWKASLRLCYVFFYLALCLSQKPGGVGGVFLRITYVPLLALVVHSYIDPAVGLAAIHLATAWAAGDAGYSLAVYRLDVGSEQAVVIADFLSTLSAHRSKEEKEAETDRDISIYFTIGMVTLLLAVITVCVVVNMPSMDPQDLSLSTLALSVITWWILYFWTLPMAMKKEALMPFELMMRLAQWFMAAFVASFPLVLISRFFLVYYFALEMMVMAMLFGYMLAINGRCQNPAEPR